MRSAASKTALVGSGRSVFLDVVRLEMAVFVIFSHSFGLISGIEPGVFGASLGGWAVRVFFVLSGWLVTESWRRDPSFARFFVRRAARIAPGFWVAFAVSVALATFFGGRPTLALIWQAARLSPPDLFAYPGSRGAIANAPMWSIGWEFFCYACTPILAFVMRGWLRIAVPAVVLVLALATGEWVMGYVAAPYCLGAILAGIPIRLPDLPVRLPDMSYGVYLYGWPIEKVLIALGAPNSEVVFAMALPLALTAGYVSHRFIERPAMRLAKRWAEAHKDSSLKSSWWRAIAMRRPWPAAHHSES